MFVWYFTWFRWNYLFFGKNTIEIILDSSQCIMSRCSQRYCFLSPVRQTFIIGLRWQLLVENLCLKGSEMGKYFSKTQDLKRFLSLPLGASSPHFHSGNETRCKYRAIPVISSLAQLLPSSTHSVLSLLCNQSQNRESMKTECSS